MGRITHSRLARALGVVFVPLLVAAGTSGYGHPLDAASPAEPYRVQLLDSDVRDVLAAEGVPLSWDYGTFGIVRLSQTQFDALRAGGLAIQPEDLHGVSIGGFVLDTSVGEPDLAPALRAEAPAAGSVVPVLVQFEAPVRPEWREALERLGAVVVDYLPANAFLVRVPAERLDRLVEFPHVQWTGPYRPAYKIHHSLAGLKAPARVEVITFPGVGGQQVLSELRPDSVSRVYEGSRFTLVEATASRDEIQAVARLPGVYRVEPHMDVTLANYRAQAVQTTGLAPGAWGARKLWDAGLDGKGQIVAVADSGLDYDHAFFRESATEIVKDGGDIYNVTDLGRRKVVRYIVMSNYSGVDPLTDPWAWKDSRHMQVNGNVTSGHGTSSSGVLAGNDEGIWSSGNDGIAKGAQLIIEDIGTVCRNPAHMNWWDDCLAYIPPDYDNLFGPAYDEGARIHSNSWGAANSNYDIKARMVDEWVWNHTDSFIVFSNGNGGPCSFGGPHNVGSPATAKSAFSSGMSETYPGEDNVDCVSSPGPTADNRMKPSGIAVGSGNTSRSSGDPWDDATTSWEGGFGGTSYSAPVHAGLAAIARQYFVDGWYPGGEPNPADGFAPSGALLKAMLLAGSRRMQGTDSDMVGENVYPNNSQGWGRAVLDDVTYFRGESRRIEVRDEDPGILGTGDLDSVIVNVVNPAEPLRIVLAWSDYPAAVGASPALVNNLNMLATAPDGKAYKGNVFYSFSESNPGESKPDAGTFDVRNPVEGVVVNAPAVGTWTISVFGGNVPMGPQPYALVVAGGLGPYPPVSVEPPSDLRAALSGPGLADVGLSWTLSPDDPYIVDHYALYVSTAYDPTRTGHAFLAEVPAGTMTYAHAGAGLGDSRSLFYYVQANTSLGDVAQSRGEAVKFVRPLGAGMELVSVPVELLDRSVASVLQTVGGKYEAVWEYDSAGADPWSGEWEAKPVDTLTSLDGSAGFWIKMLEPGELVVAGVVPGVTNVTLAAGWNLVGYPSFVDRTVADAMAGLAVEAAEGYDASGGPYYLRSLGPGDVLRAGEALWVRLSSPGLWTVSN